MKNILIVSAILLFFAGCNCKRNASLSVADKIQDCPEMMIDNRMPQIIDENSKNIPPRQYYIYKGKRYEIADFDTVWVNRNCNVEVQVVY